MTLIIEKIISDGRHVVFVHVYTCLSKSVSVSVYFVFVCEWVDGLDHVVYSH